MLQRLEKTPSERFEEVLASLFPVKLGKLKAVDDSLRRMLIEKGSIPVYHADSFAEVPYKVFEWSGGRWNRLK